MVRRIRRIWGARPRSASPNPGDLIHSPTVFSHQLGPRDVAPNPRHPTPYSVIDHVHSSTDPTPRYAPFAVRPITVAGDGCIALHARRIDQTLRDRRRDRDGPTSATSGGRRRAVAASAVSESGAPAITPRSRAGTGARAGVDPGEDGFCVGDAVAWHGHMMV
jgi:hypothetical protein